MATLVLVTLVAVILVVATLVAVILAVATLVMGTAQDQEWADTVLETTKLSKITNVKILESDTRTFTFFYYLSNTYSFLLIFCFIRCKMFLTGNISEPMHI